MARRAQSRVADTSPDRVDPDTPTGKPATIYDVARAAGVSHQTVSRYLRGYPGIRPQTRDRVIEALSTLDYRPNLTARSLTTGRSHRLAALTHEIDQVGPSRILQGASAAARDAGFLLDVVALDMTDRASVESALGLVTRHDVAGVLALGSTDEMARAFTTTDFRVPVHIASEQDDDLTGAPSQLSASGVPDLVDHLAELGHETVLHIAGPPAWAAARNRRRAYDAAMTRRGLRRAPTVHGDWSARSGHAALIGPGSLGGATAIIAANDQMALGAMRALAELGLRVPDDVSVMGIDDIPEAAYFSPPLSTLRVDFAAQGRSAVAELIGLITRGPAAPHPALLVELVRRGSTGPARRSGTRPRDRP